MKIGIVRIFDIRIVKQWVIIIDVGFFLSITPRLVDLSLCFEQVKTIKPAWSKVMMKEAGVKKFIKAVVLRQCSGLIRLMRILNHLTPHPLYQKTEWHWNPMICRCSRAIKRQYILRLNQLLTNSLVNWQKVFFCQTNTFPYPYSSCSYDI